MEKKDCYVCVCDGSCTGPDNCIPIKIKLKSK